MTQKRITPEIIFDQTRNGLDIILRHYPEAAESVNNSRRKFKIRPEEKTASATLKQAGDGVWIVTDFGGDQKPRNAIEVVRLEKGISNYADVLKDIAESYHIQGVDYDKEYNQAAIETRDAKEDEPDGDWLFFPKVEIPEHEIRVVFSEKVIEQTGLDHCRDICKKFNFYSLEKYVVIKNRKAIEISSTEKYPIFMWEYDGGKKKIYQPKSFDKAKRFMYYGGRPKDFLFGYKQCIDAYNDLNPNVDADDPKYDDLSEKEKEAARKPKKLSCVINCTGGSDAMNIAAIGYHVFWGNSETSKLPGEKVAELSKHAEWIGNLPDLDETGQRQAHELGMIYLEVRTIMLPSELLERRDLRGNPCKDVRDYLNYYKPKRFDELVKSALPYRFWDKRPEYNRQGDFVKFGYTCNNTCLYWFLSRNGFYQFKTRNGEDEIYIKITGNTVREIKPTEIKKYVNDFLAERKEDIELRNTFYRSTQLNSTSFENLPFIELDFKDYDRESQFMFFINRTWKVTAKGIEDFRPGSVAKYVWDEEVIRRRVELMDDFFTVKADENGKLGITIHNQECLFFRFLINTTRIHWKVEEYGAQAKDDDGKPTLRYHLTDEEKREQNLHLINRLYVIGYLLHRYKDASRAWAVWAMENKITEESTSDGGSGKSIFMKFVRYFMKSESIPGRDPRVTDNKHLLENITEHTDYVMVDDAHEYLNFAFFYPMITGEWHINPKNTKSYTLSYSDGPKLGFSSNFAPRNTDPSTERRLLYTVFSDYYHHTSDEHDKTRSPKDEFGKSLFDDFNEKEWTMVYNLGAQCIKLYLNHDKITPPMANVEKRKLIAEMGEVFHSWADVYFSEENKRLNDFVPREEAQEECIKKNSFKNWSAQKFMKALKAWAKFNGYKLNPEEHQNAKGRIIQNKDGMTREMIYLDTTGATALVITSTDAANKEQEGLPF